MKSGTGLTKSDQLLFNENVMSNQKELMKKFLKHHNACVAGYKWAVENCKSLDQVWKEAKPEWMIWVATREGVLTDRELHEFALWSANQVRRLMNDPRSIAALEAKRNWLDGNITDEELAAARGAAFNAAEDAARGAAWAAAFNDAEDAARGAARAAAWAAGDACQGCCQGCCRGCCQGCSKTKPY